MLGMVAGVAVLARAHVSQIPVSTVVAERLLRVEDRPDLGLTIRDASTGAVLAQITGEAGFLRLTLRGLAQQRWRDGLSADPPFRLTRWADGRVTLDDPPTSRHIELEAFGHTNEAVFAALLTAATDRR
jgi:putative photosynthetic complex assembly protein